MKKIVLFTCYCSLLITVAKAQTDSITFVKTKWVTKRITKGLIWKHYWFNKSLFDTNENINILEINLRKKLTIALGHEKQILKPVSEFGKTANSLAAINGGFFDVKNGGAVDYLKFDGQVISENHLNKNDKRAIHQKSALVFNNKSLAIAKWDGSTDWETKLEGNILNAGPILVYRKKEELLDSSLFVKKRHPRTAVVITRNRILLLTVDGRNNNSAGMSLYELAKVTKWLKAKESVNLDGGGSTTMWINGEPENGIVNYPCDNKNGTTLVNGKLLTRCL